MKLKIQISGLLVIASFLQADNPAGYFNGLVRSYGHANSKDVVARSMERAQPTIRPLFVAFPCLKKSIAHVHVANLPTPIKRLSNLGKKIGANELYIKCDDQTGLYGPRGFVHFGGNKIRKLEFLLANAQSYGARSVVTFGCAGSNHAVATAACANLLGMDCYLMLKPQPNSPVVQRNLLLMEFFGAHLYMFANNEERFAATYQLISEKGKSGGDVPYYIPTGGSNWIGALGYVNAAFELKEQISQGLMPEPDYIFVPAGSFGTSAGLLLGCAAAGLKAKIVNIAVEPEEVPGEFKEAIKALFDEMNSELTKRDKSFAKYTLDREEIILITDFTGPEYGSTTKEGLLAIQQFEELEGIRLDPTYSGKAAAGMFESIRDLKGTKKVVLFWDTFCGLNDKLPPLSEFKQLPVEFHSYFQ